MRPPIPIPNAPPAPVRDHARTPVALRSRSGHPLLSSTVAAATPSSTGEATTPSSTTTPPLPSLGRRRWLPVQDRMAAPPSSRPAGGASLSYQIQLVPLPPPTSGWCCLAPPAGVDSLLQIYAHPGLRRAFDIRQRREPTRYAPTPLLSLETEHPNPTNVIYLGFCARFRIQFGGWIDRSMRVSCGCSNLVHV